MLKFPLHSAIVTIEQKSSAYGYGYYSCSISSSFASTSVVLSSIAQVFSYLSSLLNVQKNSIKYKQASLIITDFWESA